MATRMATRRVAARGRVKIALALGAFVVVMAGVVWRRTIGYGKAVEMRRLESEYKELQAERSRLVTDIRSATSIGRLGPIAVSRLGLKYANDSQSIRLPMPMPRARN